MLTPRLALGILGLALLGGAAGCPYAKQRDLEALQARYVATHDTLVAFMTWARDHMVRLPASATGSKTEMLMVFDTIKPPPPPPPALDVMPLQH